MYRRAVGVAALSAAISRVMHDYGGGLNTACIPSALGNLECDAKRASALRSEWGGKFVVGQVGALDDDYKGQSDLIKAARILLKEKSDWRFVLVGGGKDEARLRKAANGMDENVLFAGHVNNVGDYLAAFDVMAHPSIHEGLGSTLLDAMRAGLPVVASNVGGIPEIVTNEREGLLVPPRNPRALADALRRVRDEPETAKRMAAASGERSEAYSPGIMADRYMAWYQQLGIDLILQ